MLEVILCLMCQFIPGGFLNIWHAFNSGDARIFWSSLVFMCHSFDLNLSGHFHSISILDLLIYFVGQFNNQFLPSFPGTWSFLTRDQFADVGADLLMWELWGQSGGQALKGPRQIRDLKVAVRLIVMQVAQGEGANKKCQLLYYPDGHCVTLSLGARIWLSLMHSPCVLFTF